MTLYLALFYLNPFDTTHYSNIVSNNLTTTFYKLFNYLEFLLCASKEYFCKPNLKKIKILIAQYNVINI